MAGKIAVIGDVLLDVYHFCKNRENPESSAPCYTVERTEYKPGGAGNVAANLAKLGSSCELLSIVGEDENANRLEEMLLKFKVTPIISRDRNRNTIVKERYLSANDGRYHFRADFEKKEYIHTGQVEDILKKIEGYSLILVSDYNKGIISQELMTGLKRKDIKIIGDTKPEHKNFFIGVDFIKPNLKEAREMTGLKDEFQVVQSLMDDLRTNVLLTKGKDGLSYFGINGEVYHEKSTLPAQQVVDVTGAGDTVIATFCHFLNKGFKIKECVRLANKAGEISVQYPGCYQVSEQELLN